MPPVPAQLDVDKMHLLGTKLPYTLLAVPFDNTVALAQNCVIIEMRSVLWHGQHVCLGACITHAHEPITWYAGARI